MAPVLGWSFSSSLAAQYQDVEGVTSQAVGYALGWGEGVGGSVGAVVGGLPVSPEGVPVVGDAGAAGSLRVEIPEAERAKHYAFISIPKGSGALY